MRPHGGDPALLREAFSGFPCGVVAIAAAASGSDHVLVASSFTVGVSQDPPLVMFAVQHTSSTWPILSTASRLGVSVLGEGHTRHARKLAAPDRSRRLEGLAVHRTSHGAILLLDAPIWLECSVWSTYPAGDHDIVVLRVEELSTDFAHQPLLWHRSGFTKIA
ncbi:MAG: flavin reductase family protein [Microbacterium sp.]|uniref:flavin reductase family protein n=1 Tax=Microbacterium sp. TaxID=51671 RepID=UPI001AC63DB8|nr:flavin reductase family protein [Microbacterium sp.]MBN9177904.1 flavin reductase family protein [Microbacterium sp.]